MSTRSHRLRVRLLATLGVFWLAAVVVVGVQAWQNAERTDVTETITDRPPITQAPKDPRPEQREEAEAEYVSCLGINGQGFDMDSADGRLRRWNAIRPCQEKLDLELASIELNKPPSIPSRATTTRLEVVGENVEIDWGTNAVQLGFATLVAMVVAGAVWIWTKPGEDLDDIRLAGAPKADPPKQPAPARPAKQAPTPAPIETSAPTVEADGATIEASLRRLKALHDDGILTDDEYETKRKTLTEQL